MRDERFEELMADAARTFNRVPDAPPFDDMWTEIEQARTAPVRVIAKERKPWVKPWLRTAAILIIGIGFGRASISLKPAGSPNGDTVADVQESANPALSIPPQYDAATDEYLGRAAALLISLPGELDAKRVGATFALQADDLLLQTRLLLDSPAAADPAMRTLFEDLEMVLIQVVRLQADRNETKVELLHEAIEQRDVLPRLRNAVVDHIAD